MKSPVVTLLGGAVFTFVLLSREASSAGTVKISALSELGNISTRGLVQTGDDVMIGGFIVGPTDYSDASVVVRGIGPSLSEHGVNGALEDPFLEVHNGEEDVIATNDNWMDGADAQTIISQNLGPTDPREAALLVTAVPGNYTAIVRGNGDSIGVALIEAYQLDSLQF